MFCKFMDGIFNHCELVFYLYTRSLVEKELKIDLSNLHKDSLRSSFCSYL